MVSALRDDGGGVNVQAWANPPNALLRGLDSSLPGVVGASLRDLMHMRAAALPFGATAVQVAQAAQSLSWPLDLDGPVQRATSSLLSPADVAPAALADRYAARQRFVTDPRFNAAFASNDPRLDEPASTVQRGLVSAGAPTIDLTDRNAVVRMITAGANGTVPVGSGEAAAAAPGTTGSVAEGVAAIGAAVSAAVERMANSAANTVSAAISAVAEGISSAIGAVASATVGPAIGMAVSAVCNAVSDNFSVASVANSVADAVRPQSVSLVYRNVRVAPQGDDIG